MVCSKKQLLNFAREGEEEWRVGGYQEDAESQYTVKSVSMERMADT